MVIKHHVDICKHKKEDRSKYTCTEQNSKTGWNILLKW